MATGFSGFLWVPPGLCGFARIWLVHGDVEISHDDLLNMRASGFSRHLRAPPGPGFSGCLRMWLGFYGFVRVCPDFSGFSGVTEGRHGNGFVQVSPDFSGLKGRRNDATATGFLRVSAGFSGYLRVCTGSRGILAVFPDLTRFFRVFPDLSKFFRAFPDLSKFFRIFPDLSEFFRVFLNLSGCFRVLSVFTRSQGILATALPRG